MFIQGKSMLRLTFNPGLALTGFRTTRSSLLKAEPETLLYLILYAKKKKDAMYGTKKCDSRINCFPVI